MSTGKEPTTAHKVVGVLFVAAVLLLLVFIVCGVGGHLWAWLEAGWAKW